MRGIVRKILGASRFDLDIHEASEGYRRAHRNCAAGEFGLVFLDHAMPGLNGADTRSADHARDPGCGDRDDGDAAWNGACRRPQLSGALGFLKKPFYPADVDAVLGRYFGCARRPESTRRY